MKRNRLRFFVRKYKSVFTVTLLDTLSCVLIFLLFLMPQINGLKYYYYPDMPWEERVLLIRAERLRLISCGIIGSVLIVLGLYFPILLLRFRINIKKRISECWRDSTEIDKQ